ncbi:MAG: sodium:glutamate symporter [Treponema sp.]|nr:sodium:glutamate symporter [Treponema sp.]
MNYSAENVVLWSPVVQLGIIALLVLISNILRLKVPLIKKTLMPTSVLAGFLLLGFKYTGILEINAGILDALTYHGIALGFIAMSLRVTKNDFSQGGGVRTAINSGAMIVSSYMIQGVVGLLISIGLAYTFKPDMFKAAGILLPMGFGQGPGQANNIGSSYEALGFAGGKSYALAIAATGFLVACIIGVIYLNIQARRGKFERKNAEELSGSVTLDTFQDEGEMPISQSIDRLSIQVALIVLVYVFTFFVLWAITSLLAKFAPGVANALSPIFWGFNFIFGSLFAVLTQKVLTRFRKIRLMRMQYQNNYLLSRISGLFFDVMIICGIASIDFEDLHGLWIPFALTTILGGIATFLHLKFFCKRIYKGYEEEGFLSMFGMMTGTISSGILLVREIDPDFKTPAANNLVSGSGVAIAFGAPMLILISMAPKSTASTFIVLGLLAVYYFILIGIMCIKGKKKEEAVSE